MNKGDSAIYIKGFKLPFSQLAQKAIVNFISGRTFQDDIAKADANFKLRPWIRSRLAEGSENYNADLVMAKSLPVSHVGGMRAASFAIRQSKTILARS